MIANREGVMHHARNESHDVFSGSSAELCAITGDVCMVHAAESHCQTNGDNVQLQTHLNAALAQTHLTCRHMPSSQLLHTVNMNGHVQIKGV